MCVRPNNLRPHNLIILLFTGTCIGEGGDLWDRRNSGTAQIILIIYSNLKMLSKNEYSEVSKLFPVSHSSRCPNGHIFLLIKQIHAMRSDTSCYQDLRNSIPKNAAYTTMFSIVYAYNCV